MSYDQMRLFEQIRAILNGNPGISLAVLSNVLKISRRTVQGTIAKIGGKQFKELREDCLISWVEQTLTNQPAMSIKELAFTAGFSSSRSFARAIERALHCTPTQLRSSKPSTLRCLKSNERR